MDVNPIYDFHISHISNVNVVRTFESSRRHGNSKYINGVRKIVKNYKRNNACIHHLKHKYELKVIYIIKEVILLLRK